MPNDVFISYSHKDNLPLAVRQRPEDPEKWVDWFHVRLQTYLAQLLQRDVKVWRDRRLRNEGELDDEIRNAVESSKVLVPLVSPCFAGSGWCSDEFQIFLDHLCDIGEEKRAASLIHPAVKLPTPEYELPSLLTNKLGVPFFHKDEVSERVQQWDPTNPAHAPLFAEALYGLCEDIRGALEKGLVPVEGRKVYLAHSDREGQLPRMRRELMKLDYQIVEKEHGAVALNEPALKQALTEMLDQSEVVVMLPGRRPMVKAGVDVERVEWEAIRPRLEQKRLKCLAWVDDRRTSVDAAQEAWIESIGQVAGVELLRCPFHQFLVDLEGLMKGLVPVEAPTAPALPLLVIDHHDSDAGHPLLMAGLAVLQAVGRCTLEVAWTAGLDPGALRRRRADLAERAQAMVLFSARGKAPWLKARYDEIIKHRPGFGPSLHYCLAPEGAEEKRMFFTPEHANFLQADRFDELQALATAVTEGRAA